MQFNLKSVLNRYSPSTGTGNSGSVSGGKARTNIGAITGGVAGGMVLLTAVLLFYIVCYRRRRRGVFYEYRSIYPKDILGAGMRLSILPNSRRINYVLTCCRNVRITPDRSTTEYSAVQYHSIGR